MTLPHSLRQYALRRLRKSALSNTFVSLHRRLVSSTINNAHITSHNRYTDWHLALDRIEGDGSLTNPQNRTTRPVLLHGANVHTKMKRMLMTLQIWIQKTPDFMDYE